MVDEVVANKQTIRRVYSSKSHPLDVISVPIFSVSEEVIGTLQCVVVIEDATKHNSSPTPRTRKKKVQINEEFLQITKTLTIEDEVRGGEERSDDHILLLQQNNN